MSLPRSFVAGCLSRDNNGQRMPCTADPELKNWGGAATLLDREESCKQVEAGCPSRNQGRR